MPSIRIGSSLPPNWVMRNGAGVTSVLRGTELVWPSRFAEEYSNSTPFDAIEAQWQTVLFIAIDQHVRTSGVWQVVWDSIWTGRLYGVRVSVSGTPVATTGPEEPGGSAGVTQSVTLPDFDVLPGQRIEFECYATSTNNVHRRVRSHYLKLQ